ncbi:MAG: weak similarity to aminoglycoside N(6')-acetyltransferase [uncultured Thermomicrobiales bacterium]|uniref:Weak similarity to aminoglycoside N(6')-acetyltransferase n=1 Tax=uncultured Thermomicrobiales bacterium TaxID=1645740 RepID=A0A6J4UKQ4_9BACT|nr:MAG: weak similarity to aminoglycoside N(6')-acetyltransferase [uncultured Thermomicrobiales bacterium]
MRVDDLRPNDEPAIQQVAALLVAGFREFAPDAWPNLDAALEEVRESFGPERISRVARDERGVTVGWIGGIRQYDGNVWELHPLVVRPDRQGRGIGRAAASPSGSAPMTSKAARRSPVPTSIPTRSPISPRSGTCAGIPTSSTGSSASLSSA